jgi:rhodanese-related sulfurtransferase
MKKARNIFEQLNQFEKEFGRLESKILEIDQKLEEMVSIQRNHLIRLKNQENVSDEFISSGRRYQDLSPDLAWKLYCDKNFDFILIDVSAKDFAPQHRLEQAIHIPWEEFNERSIEIQNKNTPIFVISEDGTHSILACEFLSRRGFYNCNNVSGGYEYWKGFEIERTGRSA